MEESPKRRERLKAMRMEAAQAEVSENLNTNIMLAYLSNPLIESSATPPVNESLSAVPRFDFYTDPMSAFSVNKRSSSSNQTQQNYISPTTSSGSPMSWLSSSLSDPRNLNITPSPGYQSQTNYSPNQRMYEASSAFDCSDSRRNPIEIASPFPGHQGTPPGVWNRSDGMVGYGVPFHSWRGGDFSSTGFGWGGSRSPSSGRGSSHRFTNSPKPGFGRGGGRRHGFHAFVSARERPEMFYNKSMVEDPWRMLKPVIRRLVLPVKSLNTPNSLGSWLPKSISMKKAKVSEAANEFSSQSSLADCLATSFEVINDATNVCKVGAKVEA